jgi:macrolide transport system ATP-binding/permease protein
MPDWRAEVAEHLKGAKLAPADERDIADELAQHLEDRFLDLRHRGLDERAARQGALEELGDAHTLERLLAVAVARRPVPIALEAGVPRVGWRGWWNDVKVSARMLRRTPGFTLVATLSLALAIGANTTIFSIANALLLQPLAGVLRPDELVLIGRTQEGQGFDTFSYPDYLSYRDRARTLSGIAATFDAPIHLSTGGGSERLRAGVVSGNYFRVLGVGAAAGRTFLLEEDGAPGAHPVTVLTHHLWSTRFGADSAIVGKTVTINAYPYTVVGVAAEGYSGIIKASSVDLFVPIAMIGQLRDGFGRALGARDAVWLNLFGRLAPGATPVAAESELVGIARRLEQEFPTSNAKRSATVASGLGFDPFSRSQTIQFTRILAGVVALVLLIACANVANLLLARGTARQRELSIRASLGASRGRLVRQLLAEGVLLALLGGALGIAIAKWATPLVLQLPLFAASAGTVRFPIDLTVLGFTLAVSLASAVLFGVPSALRASRVDLASAMKAGAPASAGSGKLLRNGLLVAQLAISVVLLVATGLFVRTLQALYAIPPGFEARQTLIATADVALQGYDEQRGRRFYAELERGAAALPGVRSAALAYMLPLGGGGWDTRLFAAEQSAAPDAPGLKTDVNVVTDSYFQTMGMELLAGRGFTAADRAGSPDVAVINEATATALWPGGDAVGKRFRLGRTGDPVEVIGVVPTAKYRSLLEPVRPFMYRPFSQLYQAPMTIHLGTDGDPHALTGSLRRLVASLDKDLPVYRVGTLQERLDRSIGQQRTGAMLVGTYGSLALLLAAVGLYGSMAYVVSRRTREIGIRMALGARASVVLRGVFREALTLAAIGVVLGLALAVPAAKVLRSQLFGVEASDPLTLIAVPLVLGVVTVAAAFLPARRATRVDPVTALRME